MPIGQFEASTPEKLYGGVKKLRWSDHVAPEGTLAVDFHGSRSFITHTQFGALKTKDAIVDQMRSIHGVRPSVDTYQPDIRVNVYVHENQAQVSLDLSGESLHRRGYRTEDAGAPLKENLAAALLRMAGWPEVAARGGHFIDSMCGSGTLPIEAALMAMNRAPGLHREYFGFVRWKQHDRALWEKLIREARAQERTLEPGRIFASDRDSMALRVARDNARRAHVDSKVTWERKDFSATLPSLPIPDKSEALGKDSPARGIVVLNPPYGERLEDSERLQGLYKSIGDTFKQRFRGWEGYVLTSNPDLMKSIGLKAARKFIVFNGALECRFLKYSLY
jgi:23S rRNA (guanine2445-N2)-methyltransferase / 23S rRNA (guanine2069-N7)-methyltransferase